MSREYLLSSLIGVVGRKHPASPTTSWSAPTKRSGSLPASTKLPKSRRGEFEKSLEGLTESEIDNRYIFAVVGEVICVLEVVRMLYEPVAHINRLRPLMKKALKAYLHGEESAVRREGLPFDEQIAAIDDVIRIAESQRGLLEDMNGKPDPTDSSMR